MFVDISELSGSRLKVKTLVLVLIVCLRPIGLFKAMRVCRKCIVALLSSNPLLLLTVDNARN